MAIPWAALPPGAFLCQGWARGMRADIVAGRFEHRWMSPASLSGARGEAGMSAEIVLRRRSRRGMSAGKAQ